MTTDSAGLPPPAASPEPPAKNTFQRFAGVLFAPADTFRDIARRPDIVVPLIVLVVISFVVTALIIPRMDFEAAFREQMSQQNRNMSDADLDRAVKMGSAFGKVMAWTGPIWGILIWVIIAGVLLLAHRLFGGEGNFKQAFSTVLYSWVPLIISGIVTGIVAMARGEIDPTGMQTLVKSNPAFLVDMKDNPILFAALSSLDIFTIWTIILLVIGFATLSRLSRAKSAAIIVSLWLVTVVVKLGFAALGAARAKAT
jgi:hypothetical protein